MTREDIARMARESGLAHMPGWVESGWGFENLERFASLVAAAEREACAKVCQEKWIYTASGFEMADYIRTRSNT